MTDNKRAVVKINKDVYVSQSKKPNQVSSA